VKTRTMLIFLQIIVAIALFLIPFPGDTAAGAEPPPAGSRVKSFGERKAEMTRRVEALRLRRSAQRGEQPPPGEAGAPGTRPPAEPEAAPVVPPQTLRPQAPAGIPAAGAPAGKIPEPAVPIQRMPDSDLITMNFNDVDLQTMVKFMSDLTGRNFVLDPNVKGRVTILAPEKITVAAAYQVFLSVLEVHGLSAVPAGKIIKIVPAQDARAKGLETQKDMQLSATEDKMVTQLVPLKYGDALEFTKFLAPLVPKTGLMIPHAETNTLIIIDVVSNINRLIGIIRELDVPGDKELISIIPLEHASAEKLAGKLTALFQIREGPVLRAAAQSVKIIPEERTNALIVLAPPGTMEQIENMLQELDREFTKQRKGIHVYNLQNGIAEDIAKVLGEIPGKGGSEKEGDAKKPPIVSKDVQISADKATNTIIVIAEPEEYKILADIIRTLDVARTMVYVEVLIMEVSASKSLDLGVEWRAADSFNGGFSAGTDGGVVIGGSPGAGAVDSLARGTIPSGMFAGVVGNAITLGGLTFPSFGAFVQAVRSDSDFNIISTPQILTLDNQEAKIEVGQNIPFVTTVVQQSTTVDRPIQSFEYRDVGVTLQVTPTINNNRVVRLLVEQSVKSVVESTALGGSVLAPTTTFRTAKTTITVNDGDTAVLGGLIQDRMDRGKTQTPCLGGLPALGWLFKSISDRDEKTNLMVFLSPHIVENPQEARALYERKKGEMDRFMDEAVQKQQPERLRKMGFE